MAIEIERKFLVKNDAFKALADASKRMKQGYLSEGNQRSVRVRISGSDEAYLSVKSSNDGISRLEFEYSIPLDDAECMLNDIALKPFIDKTRYFLKKGPHTWEIDEFYGDNQGLIVAEIELGNENEAFDKPDWLGPEVSHQPEYYNTNISNQQWRKIYPEKLLLKFGGTVDQENRFSSANLNPDEYTDFDCKDGC